MIQIKASEEMYFQRKTQVKRMQLHCNNIAGKIMISTTDHTMFIKGVFPTVLFTTTHSKDENQLLKQKKDKR